MVHIFEKPIFHPASLMQKDKVSVAEASRMVCGIKLPAANQSYITKVILKNRLAAGVDPIVEDKFCKECFDHPEIQLLILAGVDL
jgi:hypothetical protein